MHKLHALTLPVIIFRAGIGLPGLGWPFHLCTDQVNIVNPLTLLKSIWRLS